MRRFACVLLVAAVVATAAATPITIWVNDFSTLDGVSVPDPNDGFRVDLAAAQAGVEGKIDDPDTLFRTAIAFEKRAVAFFTDRAGSVPAGSAEQELYRELAAEEVEHVELLETEFQRWSKGKAGMLAS